MTKTMKIVRRWLGNNEQPLHPVMREVPDSPLPPAEPWKAVYAAAGIPTRLNYPSTTLSRVLDQTVDRFGSNTALTYNDRRWTYRRLLADVEKIAAGLSQLGVRRRDRVLLALPNCPDFVEVFFAIQKIGAVAVNIGPLMGADDIEKAIAITTPQVAVGLDLRAPVLAQASRKSGVEHWVWTSLENYQSPLDRLGYRVKRWYGGNGFSGSASHVSLETLMAEAPEFHPITQPEQDAIALLQPTGGTTGTLKLAQLSHRNLLSNALQVGMCMGSRPGQDRILALLPMFHAYALTTCLISGIVDGAELILLTRFNAAQTLETIRKYHPNIFPLVPAICDALCDEIEKNPDEEPIQGLQLCLSGAAPLSHETAERFERITGARLLEGYGLTEASPVTHANLPGHGHIGSIGVPMPDTQSRILALDGSGRQCGADEQGELVISGPQIMAGYFGDPDQNKNVLSTDESGTVWLHTGDIATMDADGFFHILDRKKDMIIHSGLKIYPTRVERLLMSHAQVKDAAVFGRDDPAHTEQVIAAIVPKNPPDNPAALAAELRAFCRAHLAPYEVPALIEFIEVIPKTPLGKVQRAILRKTRATLAQTETQEAA